MYSVLGKVRVGEPLNTKEKVIHDQGSVSVLRRIHHDLERLAARFKRPPKLTKAEQKRDLEAALQSLAAPGLAVT